MPVISKYKRQRIIDLAEADVSQREIAKLLNISRGGVQCFLKRYRECGDITNKTKNQNRKKLTERDERKLCITSKRNPKMVASELRAACNLTHVSVDTVKRTLRKYGQMGRIACRKPSLNMRQKKLRLKFSKNCANFSINDWSKIIFSDESKIELEPSTRQYVRRKVTDNKFAEKYVNTTKKFRKSIMIWGAIRYDGKRVLVRCNGNVDQYEYQRILDVGLPQICNNRFKLQQDGASSHRAYSTKQYFTRKSIRLFDQPWPPQSPDLSIIENIWDLLKEMIKNHKATSEDELWKVC